MNRRVVIAGAVLAGMTMMVITLAGVFVAASVVSAALDDSSTDLVESARVALADTAAAQADEGRAAGERDSDVSRPGHDFGDEPDPEDVEHVVRKSLQLSGMAERLLGEPLDITIVAAGEDGEVPMHLSEGLIDLTAGGLCGALDGVEDEVGVLVTGVVPDSAADEAGLSRGDIILAVDGQAVDDTIALHDALSELSVGDAATLDVLHGDDARTLSAELGECEGEPFLGVRLTETPMSVGVLSGRLPHLDGLKLHGSGMPHDLMSEVLDGLDGDMQGLVVLDVVDASAAESAGVERGDVIVGVNGAEVTEPDALTAAVGELESGDTLTLTVRRSSDEPDLALELTLGESLDDPDKAFAGIVAAYIEAHVDGEGEGERRIRIEMMPGGLGGPGIPGFELIEGLGASDRVERGLEMAKEIVGADD